MHLLVGLWPVGESSPGSFATALGSGWPGPRWSAPVFSSCSLAPSRSAEKGRGGIRTTRTRLGDSGLTEFELDDDVLATRVARADVAAFVILYDRYARRVHAWAAQALGSEHADDAVQEVFLRVWRSAGQFDPARGRLSTWLFAIARHHIGRDLAARGRDRRVAAADAIDDVLAHAPDPAPPVDEDVTRRERARALGEALRTIPAEQRRVLLLAYFTGATQVEMASTLGIPLGTVKKRVRLGLQKLRATLGDHAEPAKLRIVSDR